MLICTGFELSQLSYLSSLVSKSVTWKADGRGFESHPRQPIFLWKMTVSGDLCCIALPFCCVVVALPFSSSLGEYMYVYIVLDTQQKEICWYILVHTHTCSLLRMDAVVHKSLTTYSVPSPHLNADVISHLYIARTCMHILSNPRWRIKCGIWGVYA